jgi:hypothetical protein
MSLHDLLLPLPVELDGSSLSSLSQHVSSGFERVSTVVHFTGGGLEGQGEDVVYDADDQRAFQRAGIPADLSGSWTLETLGARIDELDLFPTEPAQGDVARLYRRWALHSAALDLALRQAGMSLHGRIGRPAKPVNFVVSLRLGDPADTGLILGLLERYPTLRFKLVATSSWDDAVIATLAGTEAVDAIDLKGHYAGSVVDNPPDPELYRRVVEGFPDAWIEDPNLSAPGCAEALADAHDRITWDAVIHSIGDIDALPFAPRTVNIKPSRFGSLRALLDGYEYCEAHGITAYGGGQFELGVGRGQAQYLASVMHPDATNDLAPTGFNTPEVADGLPSSPLAAEPSAVGFRWGTTA